MLIAFSSRVRCSKAAICRVMVTFEKCALTALTIFKGYRDFEGFQFLNLLFVLFDFGGYLKLNIVSVRAIFCYFLCFCIPVFKSDRNA